MTASGAIYGQLPGEMKLLREQAKACFGPARIRMNKRTDCQPLTICHHWQPIRQTELISLLFTLFTVFLYCFQPVILPHSNIMYKYNCNTVFLVQVSVVHPTKRIITCRLVSPYVLLLSADGQSSFCVGRVAGVIFLPTHDTHFSDVPDIMKGYRRQCC